MTYDLSLNTSTTKRQIARFLQTTKPRIHAYDEASSANKTLFHRRGMAVLRRVAQDLGYQPGTYDVRSNKGGMAVSGEVILHTDDLYVQLSCSAFGSDHQIMYRRCQGRRDYCGLRNHFLPFRALEDYPQFITCLQTLRESVQR